MTRRDAGALLAVTALALGLRVFGVDIPATPTGDEPYHVPAAQRFLATGQLDDTTWSQPPLAPVLLAATIAVLGDNAWGWRVRSALLGALSAAALALLLRALYPDRPRVAVAAGLLLALDPIHVLLSRSTLEETQVVFFFLASAWLVVRHVREGRPGLVGAGLLLGCAHASKAYFHPAGLVLLGIVLWNVRRREGPAMEYVHALLSLLLLPAAVYVAAYLPWFARGYGTAEFLELQRSSLRALASKTLATFANGSILALGGSPASWFIRPAVFGFRLPSEPGALRALVFAKNFLAWAAVLPAVALVVARSVRGDRADAVLGALFTAAYLPLLLVARPIFLYSAVAVLPFGIAAVARALDLAAGRTRTLARVGFAASCVLALYLYPLATARIVPGWAYALIASSPNVLGAGGAPR